MTTFDSFGLPETVLGALQKIGFTEATPIQASAIPFALAGRDVLGSASTGTGKTAAFSVPMITHLINSPRSMALIMTPTRELAVQVLTMVDSLLMMHKEIATACLIGGEPIGRQLNQLQRKPRVIVGTPGRINDHLARGSLRLANADFLVLDETDRMLDMGFGIQIEKIIAMMAKKRQSLMFSATLPPEIVKMSSKYLVNPERVSVGVAHQPSVQVKQELVHVPEADKYTALLEQLDGREGSIIVFVKTKYGADRLATKLDRADYAADAIHGDLQQRRRDRVIQAFREQRFRILVATDVAARGLDIPHIEHVINYDLPQCPEDYIHRVGRTGRNGAEGVAVNLITPADGSKWRAIERLINPGAPRDPRDRDEGARKPQRRRGFGGNGPKKFGDKGARREGGQGRGGQWDPRDRAPSSSAGPRAKKLFNGKRMQAAGGR